MPTAKQRVLVGHATLDNLPDAPGPLGGTGAGASDEVTPFERPTSGKSSAPEFRLLG